MPSTQNADLLDAMADQIRDVLSAVTDIDIQIEPRLVQSPTPPTIDMHPGDLSRGTDAAAFGTEGEFLFTVRCRVNENDATANQDLLLAFMDDVNALSVPMALLEDPTLGGLATSLDIRDPTGFVNYPLDPREVIGFQFTCMVIRADT